MTNKDFHIRSIDKKHFDEINKIRKMRNYTWAEMFEHFYVHRGSFISMLGREMKEDICSTKSGQTVHKLLPLWCSNIAHNIPDILQAGDISNIICETRKDNSCPKLAKLKEMLYDKKNEYDVDAISKELSIPPDLISILIRNIMTYMFQNGTGSAMCITCDKYKASNKPALIIAGGPSLKTYNHLALLKKYGFDGDIFVVSKVLKDVLEAGIVPKYVGALDAEEFDTTFIDYDIVDKYSDQMTGLFGINIHPTTVNRWKGKRYYFSGYIGEEIPNISHIFHLMTETSNISVSGNIGSCIYNIASYLGYNKMILIGMDLSFPSLKSMKEYYPLATEKEWNSQDVVNGKKQPKYKRGYNPDFKKTYYTEPVFEAYKISTLSWTKTMTSTGIQVVNCSEQGSLHGNGIVSMKFEEYLKSQNTLNETEAT